MSAHLVRRGHRMTLRSAASGVQPRQLQRELKVADRASHVDTLPDRPDRCLPAVTPPGRAVVPPSRPPLVGAVGRGGARPTGGSST